MAPVLTRARAMCPRGLPLLGLLAVAALSIWPAWPPLFETWQAMPEYSYSLLLVPFIVFWIAARSVDLPPPTTRTSPLAAATLLVTLAGWLIAYQASSSIGEQLLIPVILWSAVWIAFGLPIAHRLAVPLACLYFAIPVWEFLVPFLQSASVWVSQTVLGFVGIPVHISGDLVSIPEGTFRIEEACAGRRYFIVGLTIAAVFAGTIRMRPLRVMLFMPIAAALSIIANWIRILIVIYAGHITDMTSYLVVKEHLTLGWFIFALNIVVVCLIGERIARSGTLPPLKPDARDNQSSAIAFLRRPAVPATVLILLVPALAIAYSDHELAPGPPTSRHAAVQRLPMEDAFWTGPGLATQAWRPKYLGADAFARASYASPLGNVDVFVADYLREKRGAKLVSGDNALFPSNWMVLGRGEISGGERSRLAAQPRLIRAETPAGERWMITYLYRVGRVVTANAILEQLAYGVLAWGGPTPARIAVVATRCRSSCSEARQRLERFWNTAGTSLLATRAVDGSGSMR